MVMVSIREPDRDQSKNNLDQLKKKCYGIPKRTLEMNQQVNLNYPKCECHDCTQARWKMSFQGQLSGSAGQFPDQNNTALKAAQQQYADVQTRVNR